MTGRSPTGFTKTPNWGLILDRSNFSVMFNVRSQ